MSPVSTPQIAVVGAGEMGRMTMDLIQRQSPHARFRVYDRSRISLDRVRAAFPNAELIECDLLRDGLPGLAGSDLVINFAGPFFAGADAAARAALDVTVPYVDICDDAEGTAAVLELDAEAKAKGIGLVTGAGNSPGTSNVLARALLEEDNTIDGIRVVWVVRDEDPGGLAPLRHMLHMAVVPCPIWQDGAMTTTPGFQPSTARTHQLPEPVGEVTAFDTSHPEPVTLGRRYPHLRHVSCQGALLPRWSNDAFSVLGRIGFGDPTLHVEIDGRSIEPTEVLWRMLWKRYEARQGQPRTCVTVVQVQGLRGDDVTTTATIRDDFSMVRTTGVGAATAALALLAQPAPAGAWGAEILPPDTTLQLFQTVADSIGAVPDGIVFESA